MLGALFTLPSLNLSPLMAIVLIVVAYLAFRRFAGPAAANAALDKLMPRLGNLMRFIDSLGLPFLGPLLQAVSLGKWTDVPGEVNTLLNLLDDKTQRQAMLLNLTKQQLRDHLSDPVKREAVLLEIEKTLGVTIPRPVPSSP